MKTNKFITSFTFHFFVRRAASITYSPRFGNLFGNSLLRNRNRQESASLIPSHLKLKHWRVGALVDVSPSSLSYSCSIDLLHFLPSLSTYSFSQNFHSHFDVWIDAQRALIDVGYFIPAVSKLSKIFVYQASKPHPIANWPLSPAVGAVVQFLDSFIVRLVLQLSKVSSIMLYCLSYYMFWHLYFLFLVGGFWTTTFERRVTYRLDCPSNLPSV